jgi:hypothetical protein
MVAGKKLSKLARIGMSHSDKARALGARGMYAEALSELRIALFSLRSENRDGSLNEEIAGVLNSIGSVNLLLHKYREAAEAYADAVAIRKPMYNNPEVAGSLLGLADAYRGTCDFDRAVACLEEALHVALSLKNTPLAARVSDAMDALERTRNDMPSRESATSGNDLYLPPELDGVYAVLRNLDLDISEGSASLSMIIGFPGLDSALASRGLAGDQFPCAGLFFGAGAGQVSSFSVIDEEEEPVESAAIPFEGHLFAPGSYHREGPLPVPACKKLTFAGGAGSLLQWKILANSWCRAEAGLDLPGLAGGFKLALALPYHIRLSRVGIQVRKPLEYGMLRIDEGTFYATRSPERITSGNSTAYAFKRRLFEGSAFGALDIEAGSSLKHAVIAFELSR